MTFNSIWCHEDHHICPGVLVFGFRNCIICLCRIADSAQVQATVLKTSSIALPKPWDSKFLLAWATCADLYHHEECFFNKHGDVQALCLCACKPENVPHIWQRFRTRVHLYLYCFLISTRARQASWQSVSSKVAYRVHTSEIYQTSGFLPIRLLTVVMCGPMAFHHNTVWLNSDWSDRSNSSSISNVFWWPPMGFIGLKQVPLNNHNHYSSLKGGTTAPACQKNKSPRFAHMVFVQAQYIVIYGNILIYMASCRPLMWICHQTGCTVLRLQCWLDLEPVPGVRLGPLLRKCFLNNQRWIRWCSLWL